MKDNLALWQMQPYEGDKPMKYTFTVSRILLGLMFTVFGLNGFLHFIPNVQFQGPAGQVSMESQS
jgi:hypothetical protein